VNDSDLLKRRPALTDATNLLNTASQITVENFDRGMRDLARRRQIEYAPELAQELVRLANKQLLQHARELPRRGSHPALLREPSESDRDAIVASMAEHGLLLACLPRPEEGDKLMSDLRDEFTRRGIADKRDDLLLDAPSTSATVIHFLRNAVGSPPPSFTDRVFASIESRREQLWVKRTESLNWELFDYGKVMLNDLLLDAIHRTAIGTPMAGMEPDTNGLNEARQLLSDRLAKRLFLWQKSRDDLVKEMDSELQMPGWGNVWTQPIINRVNMLATGVRTQIGVKVYGPTGKSLPDAMTDIQRVSEQITVKLKTVRGAVDVTADQALGKRYVEFQIDREKAERYGVNVADIGEAIETAIGGSRTGW
jgi:Cu(I)/Ag(I) efflux system membrane protein CusA/SilA